MCIVRCALLTGVKWQSNPLRKSSISIRITAMARYIFINRIKKGFLKEFKILTEVRCKYLAKLLGVYESDQSIYIVQELYDRTLHNYLNKFGFLETTPSRRLLYQLLIGLKFLHQRRIMHRDIKLENIMIRGPNKDNIEPVIVDFGLA